MPDKTKIILLNNELIEIVKSIVISSRQRVFKIVNHELIRTYWEIDKSIIDTEKNNNIDALTSRQIILDLSKQLIKELGKGFSRSNLFNMRKFYLEYPTVQTLSGQLNWSHICELLIIENKDKRSFYEKEITYS